MRTSENPANATALEKNRPSGATLGKWFGELDRQQERAIRRRLGNWSRTQRGLSPQDFDDVYQDAWCRLLEGERRGRRVRNYEGALLWAVHNSWLMEQRRRRRRPAPADSAPWDSLSAGEGADPVKQIEVQEAARRVFEAIAIVPERQRQIVLLADVAGLPPAEVRVRLGISERTYHRDRARALHAMSARLGGLLTGVGRQDAPAATAPSVGSLAA